MIESDIFSELICETEKMGIELPFIKVELSVINPGGTCIKFNNLQKLPSKPALKFRHTGLAD